MLNLLILLGATLHVSKSVPSLAHATCVELLARFYEHANAKNLEKSLEEMLESIGPIYLGRSWPIYQATDAASVMKKLGERLRAHRRS